MHLHSPLTGTVCHYPWTSPNGVVRDASDCIITYAEYFGAPLRVIQVCAGVVFYGLFVYLCFVRLPKLRRVIHRFRSTKSKQYHVRIHLSCFLVVIFQSIGLVDLDGGFGLMSASITMFLNGLTITLMLYVGMLYVDYVALCSKGFQRNQIGLPTWQKRVWMVSAFVMFTILQIASVVHAEYHNIYIACVELGGLMLCLFMVVVTARSMISIERALRIRQFNSSLSSEGGQPSVTMQAMTVRKMAEKKMTPPKISITSVEDNVQTYRYRFFPFFVICIFSMVAMLCNAIILLGAEGLDPRKKYAWTLSIEDYNLLILAFTRVIYGLTVIAALTLFRPKLSVQRSPKGAAKSPTNNKVDCPNPATPEPVSGARISSAMETSGLYTDGSSIHESEESIAHATTTFEEVMLNPDQRKKFLLFCNGKLGVIHAICLEEIERFELLAKTPRTPRQDIQSQGELVLQVFFDHVDELGLDQCRKELLPLECSPGKYKLIPVGAFDTLKREVKGFMKTVLFPQYLGHLQTKSSRRLLDTFVSGTWLIPPQPKHSECKSPNTSPKSATSVNYF
mmetsp:Transcript_22683/g.49320  ORF Transcript_22683/g.49320 Transcript_22683/m.49320 type:complete len:564 (-) Transcript_22683:2465-4156(-)